MKQAKLKKISGAGCKFAVITSRFNIEITAKLQAGCLAALKQSGVKQKDIAAVEVPGAFELPWAAQKMAKTRKYDAIICLGAVIKGETDHYEYISSAVANGIMQTGLKTGVPVIFGVLTCRNLAQAKARTIGKFNKGIEAGWAAVYMAKYSNKN